MLAWVREVYLSIFVLFFRISRWKGEMKSRSASMAVSLLLGVQFAAIWATVQVVLGRPVTLNRWFAVGVLAVVFAFSDYVLVIRRAGPEFAERFQKFATSKQVRLYTTAILIGIASTVALFTSVSCYRHSFGAYSRPYISK